MANNIPLLEGTDAAGGYLVPDEIRETLVNGINAETGITQLVPATQVAGKRQKYATYAGRTTASFVNEGATKPVTGAEYGQVVVDIKKIATTVIYTEELLEDAREDPTVLVSLDVQRAFSDLIDAHALGFANGTAITSAFNNKLGASTSTIELGTGQDALATAVSDAMAIIEANGGTPNGIALASDGRSALRNARDADGRPLFTQGFAAAPSDIYGLNLAYTHNLDGYPAGAGKVVAIVGDYSHAKLNIRKDISVRYGTEGIIVDGGTTHNLLQENKVAAIWEARLGFAAHDLNRNFVVITNAS